MQCTMCTVNCAMCELSTSGVYGQAEQCTSQPGWRQAVYHVCNTCIYCTSKQESTLLSVQNAPAEGQDRDRQGGSTPDTPPSVLNLQAESHVYLQGYCTASQDRDRLGRQAACKSVTGQGSQSGHFTTNPSL